MILDRCASSNIITSGQGCHDVSQCIVGIAWQKNKCSVMSNNLRHCTITNRNISSSASTTAVTVSITTATVVTQNLTSELAPIKASITLQPDSALTCSTGWRQHREANRRHPAQVIGQLSTDRSIRRRNMVAKAAACDTRDIHVSTRRS